MRVHTRVCSRRCVCNKRLSSGPTASAHPPDGVMVPSFTTSGYLLPVASKCRSAEPLPPLPSQFCSCMVECACMHVRCMCGTTLWAVVDIHSPEARYQQARSDMPAPRPSPALSGPCAPDPRTHLAARPDVPRRQVEPQVLRRARLVALPVLGVGADAAPRVQQLQAVCIPVGGCRFVCMHVCVFVGGVQVLTHTCTSFRARASKRTTVHRVFRCMLRRRGARSLADAALLLPSRHSLLRGHALVRLQTVRAPRA